MKGFLFVAATVALLAAMPPSAAAARHSGTVTTLAAEKKIRVETLGTGRSIGSIADLKIRNLGSDTLIITVPAMVLESRSKQYQDYACPRSQTVRLGAGKETTVSLEGICLMRAKLPVGRGVRDELIVCDGHPSSPRNPDSHYSPKEARKLVRVAKSYGDAADKLEREHKLKEIPYHDAKKRKEIVEQWGIWMDPEISKRTGTRRATKTDLKETILRQARKQAPLEPVKKQELERGVDEIFQDIQLTSKEAKALEEPDPFQAVELTGPNAKAEG